MIDQAGDALRQALDQARWLRLLAAILCGGGLIGIVLAGGDLSSGGPGDGAFAVLVLGGLLLAHSGVVVGGAAISAGLRYAVPAWKESDGWTKPTFEIERRHYDPEGSAWAEIVSASRAHGYELDPDQGPTDWTWRFTRVGAGDAPRDIR